MGCSQTLDESQRDQMWFDLLDSLMKSKSSSELKNIVKHVVTSSLGHISLQNLIDRILRDPTYQSINFGEFLKDILEMYHYEETLIISTTQAVHQDIHELQVKLQEDQQKAYSVWSLGCN